MRAYLVAQAAKQHERQFDWKGFRVLAITTDQHRLLSNGNTAQNPRPAQPRSAPFFIRGTPGASSPGPAHSRLAGWHRTRCSADLIPKVVRRSRCSARTAKPTYRGWSLRLAIRNLQRMSVTR